MGRERPAIGGHRPSLFCVFATVVALLATQSRPGNALPDVIRIGVVYDKSHSSEEEKLLSQALDRANLNASDAGEDDADHQNADGKISGGTGQIQAAAAFRTPHLSLAIERLEPDDMFRSAKKVCGLLEQGVLAVLGPGSPSTASLVRSACSRHRVPHVYVHRDSEATGSLIPDSISVTLAPSPEELGLAYRHLVEAQRWKQFTIIYEKPQALVRLRSLLQLSSSSAQPIPVSLRRLADNRDPRPLLREIAKAGENNIVLDLTAPRLADVLRHAQKIGIITEYHNYVVTTLDLHTIDLSDFQNSRTNLSAFQLLNRDMWEQDIGAMREAYARTGIYPLFLGNRAPRRPVGVDAALAQDALDILVRAIQGMARARTLGRPPSVRCRGGDPTLRPWAQSRTLVDAVKKIHFSGLTGPVWLDPLGRRYNLTLHVVQLKRAGLASIGKWSASTGLQITRTEQMLQEEILSTLRNKTFKITTILNAPYVMLKDSADKLNGNDRFEGFCVDLLRELALLLGFRYQLKLVRDGAHGTRDSRGRWNGMVRELIDREADLAIGDLTITYVREEAVDFTMPFMTLGVSILFRKPQGEQTLLFFLSPLSVDVWLCMAAAYVAVSLLLFGVARVGTAEWCGDRSRSSGGRCCCSCPFRDSLAPAVGPTECGSAGLDIIAGGRSSCVQERMFDDECEKREGARVIKNQFTLLNSLWFTISAIMQQGCDTSPRSASTRIIAAAWWFFSFVVISSYTANLASFLTRERLRSPIESVDDLAKQSEIRYGCVRSGSTQAFFKESKHETYERMWQTMKEDLVSSNAEGVARVEAGGYAFLMESTSIEYVVQRRCQLTQIGGLLDSKGYGIATPLGSPYRSLLSSAILKLQENGTLQLLKDRWWKVTDPSLRCPDDTGLSSPGSANELGLPKVGGVFVVLLAGLGLACLIAFAEVFFKARSTRGCRSPVSASGASSSRQLLRMGHRHPL